MTHTTDEEALRLVQSTAPDHIWLDLGEDFEMSEPTRFRECDDVTWSEDNATGNGIRYVREDLAAHAAPVPKAGEAEAFEQLCREHGIEGTAAARQCEVFWSAGARFAGASDREQGSLQTAGMVAVNQDLLERILARLRKAQIFNLSKELHAAITAPQPVNPSQGGRPRTEAGTEPLPEECPFVIIFDDADLKPLHFAGAGSKTAALTAYERASTQWNAHLFVRIAHNSRDDRFPDASLDTPQTESDDQATRPASPEERKVYNSIAGNYFKSLPASRQPAPRKSIDIIREVCARHGFQSRQLADDIASALSTVAGVDPQPMNARSPTQPSFAAGEPAACVSNALEALHEAAQPGTPKSEMREAIAQALKSLRNIPMSALLPTPKPETQEAP